MLTGCYRPYEFNFKVGDCISYKSDLEKWDPPHTIEKIVEIGKEKYRYVFESSLVPGQVLTLDNYKTFAENKSKVECPLILDTYEKVHHE